MTPIVADNLFFGNVAGTGGGIRFCFFYDRLPEPIVTGNIIVGNAASIRGGGVDCEKSDPILNYTTIDGNDAPEGGGVYSFSGGGVKLINSIIANTRRGGGLFADDESTIETDFCDVWNNHGGDYQGCEPGSTDISAPPRYIGIEQTDVRLDPSSRCIGSGENGSDIGALGRRNTPDR